MVSVIGETLGSAFGVAISPVPIMAVILMLFSSRAMSNSLGFLIGWVTGLTAVGLLVLAVAPQGSQGEASVATGWIKIVIGVAFLALAVKQWAGRPRPGKKAETPKWMATIDDFTLVKAIASGLLLSAVNPKNLGLTLAAGLQITAAGLSRGEELGVLAVFVAVASATIAAPVLLSLVLRDKATGTLQSMKSWLVDNNNVVMSVLLVVLGATVLGEGVAIVA